LSGFSRKLSSFTSQLPKLDFESLLLSSKSKDSYWKEFRFSCLLSNLRNVPSETVSAFRKESSKTPFGSIINLARRLVCTPKWRCVEASPVLKSEKFFPAASRSF
jgi:hypothetical protein